jgi:hypothetical protein
VFDVDLVGSVDAFRLAKLPTKRRTVGGGLMAPYIDISANSISIRRYAAQRVGWNRPGANSYRVFVRTDDLKWKRIGTLSHRYEDGADVLAMRVMQLVTLMQGNQKLVKANGGETKEARLL